MKTLEAWLLSVWYGHKPLAKYALLPLSALYCLISRLKQLSDQRKQVVQPVPVIVVGNITVGGTGKTPVVIWLVEQLQALGLKVGVISRGYGGKASVATVTANSDPQSVGDEPVLIAQRTHVPLVVGRQRNLAIQHLLANTACDVIISDDGLQHYAMARALEIVVVDGQRQFGNGYCLPAGALREPLSRLQSVDFVLTNGQNLQMQGDTLINLKTGDIRPLSEFMGQSVHVVTGIGNPQRFITRLQDAGLMVIAHIYPDHYAFNGTELQLKPDLPILMTEKDAVKCRAFAAEQVWYLPITAHIETELAQRLLTRIRDLVYG
jgi:tetraacyldisaccharide 4'-kinase